MGLLSIWLCLLTTLGASAAAGEQSFYSATVNSASSDPAEQGAALERALLAVLIKASGDGALRDDPEISAVLAEAPNLLRDSRIEVDVGGSARFSASFDAAGVNTLLKIIGRPLWQSRPRSVVWLVIDDGSSKRVATAAQAAALIPLTARAAERGVPIVIADFNSVDRALLDPEVLWIGSPELIARASARYAPIALVVRLSRQDGGWAARYTLIDGARVEDWRGSYNDANDALAAAIDGAANRLAVRYAVAAEDLQPATIRVWIAGIARARDYAAAIAALNALSEVNAITIEGADGDRLQVLIDAKVRLERLLRLQGAAGDARLAQVIDAPTDGADAVLELVRN